jgi:hypothetical protein
LTPDGDRDGGNKKRADNRWDWRRSGGRGNAGVDNAGNQPRDHHTLKRS